MCIIDLEVDFMRSLLVLGFQGLEFQQAVQFLGLPQNNCILLILQ